jgi:hypothetical protein
MRGFLEIIWWIPEIDMKWSLGNPGELLRNPKNKLEIHQKVLGLLE